MEQRHLVDGGLADPGSLAGMAPIEPERAMRSTVVSGREWLAVSTEGFSEQQRGRPLAHLVKELVQNALDSVGTAGRIALTVKPQGATGASRGQPRSHRTRHSETGEAAP